MKPKIILVGGGGHCRSCIDVIEQEGKYLIAGIIDVTENLHQKILGYDIIGTDLELPDLLKEYDQFLITIGQIKSAIKRRMLFERLKALNAKFPVIISPFAYVSRHAQIGEGTIVMHKAVVNAGARVGKNCIINTKALIEHDAQIGDHCHIATASVINGGVKVGSETFFGSNAVSREYIEIGEKSVIGCNVKVVKNVPSGSLLK
jgi:sugar O-acyltransferase (sialic acid O-acetyltransferase NeuD family)